MIDDSRAVRGRLPALPLSFIRGSALCREYVSAIAGDVCQR